MNKAILILLSVIGLLSCKTKKPYDSTKAYFSVTNFLQTELKKMDTVNNHFSKIITRNNISDTISISKDEFKKYAKEFLTLPDISSDDLKEDYEESNSYDEDLGKVLLIYTPKNKGIVRRETIMMDPDESGNTHIATILANTINQDDDNTIEKDMTWHVNKRLQIVTKTSKQGSAENIELVTIKWE